MGGVDVADRMCSVDGCEKREIARGWCPMHYYRMQKHGSLDLPPRVRPDRTKRTCSVDGCGRSVWSREMCNLHYSRQHRHGEVGPVESTTAPPGSGCLRPDGYRTVYSHGHPLADSRGQILEHRLVLYSVIGPDPHPCHWCSLMVRWDRIHPRHGDALVGDHLNHDRSDNAPANLVPSCGPCNAKRQDRTREKAA